MLNSVMHCFECGRNVDFECGHRVETAADETYCCVCAGGEIDGLNEKIDALRVENDRLRALTRKLEEERRWRKWPEEKPEVEQQCQLILANKLAPILCCSKYPFDHWENLNATHWRPIGPLPGGEL